MIPVFDPTVADALLPWYDEHARDLPWRRTSDPYKILVSEFMLQQTQVKTVLPYYAAFLDRFPDLDTLSCASIDEVLEAWKGLGYYRRARNLHASAQAIVEQHAGVVPERWDAVRSLPGVGDYTAAAVLSIAFGQAYPVVDGNVIRVAARLLALDEPVDSVRLKRRVADRLREVMPTSRPGDFNQAMMELGATVCTVPRPACDRCPLCDVCRARASGREEELPVPGKRTKVREERFTVVVLRLANATLLVKRLEEGLLAGMWEFPRLPSEGEPRGQSPRQALSERLTPEALKGTLGDVRRVGTVVHRFSHLVWHLDVVRINVVPTAGVAEVSDHPEGVQWAPDDRVGEIALPRVMQKVWELVLQSEKDEES